MICDLNGSLASRQFLNVVIFYCSFFIAKFSLNIVNRGDPRLTMV